MKRHFSLLFLVVLLAAPATASAYRLQPGGYRWEAGTVAVWVADASLRAPVDRAIAQWNALGLRVHLVRTTSLRRAFVTVRLEGRSCVGGVTEVLDALDSGRIDGRSFRLQYFARAKVRIARGCSPALSTFVAAHELGHVLGLAHETRVCALMNPSADEGGRSPQCAGSAVSSSRAIRADDRAGVRALYRRPLSVLPLVAYRRYFPF